MAATGWRPADWRKRSSAEILTSGRIGAWRTRWLVRGGGLSPRVIGRSRSALRRLPRARAPAAGRHYRVGRERHRAGGTGQSASALSPSFPDTPRRRRSVRFDRTCTGRKHLGRRDRTGAVRALSDRPTRRSERVWVLNSLVVEAPYRAIGRVEPLLRAVVPRRCRIRRSGAL